MVGHVFGQSDYLFRGKHFFASYLGCDVNQLSDVERLMQAMDRAVAASGATVLNQTFHRFPPHGLTMLYLLSESHASLHTYPEHGACFIDLFTCGDHCSSERFHEALMEYLQPKEVTTRFFIRTDSVDELPFP
ncbi:MAG: adenosylmethionine decarboxylase [Verrucomicrobia bacterium]|nr:adenosylmethionine decarboxylase [Verrucomicrobiota bacterium]MDE3047188.1 adenosylmethionine decarboxylase [Verrucomicrobiota bacterium]